MNPGSGPTGVPAGHGASNTRLAVIVVAVVVALLVIVAITQSFSGGGGHSNRPSLATASVRSFPVVVTADGTVVPACEIGLNFSAPGTLTQIAVKVGQTVATGTVLAKVDPTMANADLAAAQAELAAAVTSPEVGVAHGDIAKAQAELAATSLVAPANGTIEAINGQVGETASAAATAAATLPGTCAPLPVTSSSSAVPTPGAPALIELSTSSGVVVGAAFDGGDALLLAANQKGQLTSEVLSNLSLPCHVVAVSSVATLIDGFPRYYASIAPDGSDAQLLSGMPVEVSITAGQANNVIAVPNQAIFVLDGQAQVDVWFKGRAIPTVVTAGLVGAQLTEIKSGLSAGQQVVLSAPSGLPLSATNTSS